MGKHIVIYQDEGAGKFGISCLQRFFKDDSVHLVLAEDVIDNSAFELCDVFVMPGGADLPYCKKLNGAGNANIRQYVEQGGTYLGICAGAYYACSSIEYHKGRPDEICEERELALINTTAIGSLPDLAPYYDDTLQSAAIIPVSFENNDTALALYYGGCTFSKSNDFKVLAIYGNGDPAIIHREIRKGHALLSGVHFECNSNDILSYPCKNEDDIDRTQQFSQDLRKTNTDWHSLFSITGTQTK